MGNNAASNIKRAILGTKVLVKKNFAKYGPDPDLDPTPDPE
jgi:hypothetical protein